MRRAVGMENYCEALCVVCARRYLAIGWVMEKCKLFKILFHGVLGKLAQIHDSTAHHNMAHTREKKKECFNTQRHDTQQWQQEQTTTIHNPTKNYHL
jgi:hypothetical protein